MGARGIYHAQETHLVNLIPPADISAGVTTAVFNMKNYEHVSIVIQLGATSAAPSKISLLASDNGSPEGTAAVGFDVFKCETAYGSANGDVLGTRVACAAADGFAPSGTDDIFYVIELDAAALPSGKTYVKLVVASGTGVYGSAVAILSAGRFTNDQSDTVLT